MVHMNIYKFRFTRIMFCFGENMNPFILLYHVINESGTSKEMVTSWTPKKEAANSS